jgi:hypothetical protein
MYKCIHHASAFPGPKRTQSRPKGLNFPCLAPRSDFERDITRALCCVGLH